ncbi:MAG: S53 family peptidase [Thermoplasmata archaeon]|nr:S53 family peptidase [Thermoplasmata archaeon]
MKLRALRPALVILLAAATIANSAPFALAAGPHERARGVSSPSAMSPDAAAIPAALLSPWAARAGYSPAYAAEVAGAGPASGNLTVSLQLWPSTTSFFRTPAPGAPGLSVGSLADRYGLSPAAYSSLVAYFTHRGLAVLHAWPDRLGLTVSGPAAAMGTAFGTQVLQGSFEGRTVTFPASVPTLPGPFATEVAAVSGLTYGFSRFTIPFATAALPAGFGVHPAITTPSRSTDFVTPAGARLVYDLNGLYNVSGTPKYATGIGIALLLWGWGYDPADIQGFFGTYYPSQFPAVQYSDVAVDGAPAASAQALNDPSNAPLELTLDIEWAGSMAPGANLYAVHGPDGPANNNYSPTDATLEDALNTAVNGLSGVRAISMSFGTPDSSDASFQAAFSLQFAKAANRGITLLAASGDNAGDAKTSCTGGPSPQFPAASPDVLAVGGTAPILTADPLGQVTGLSSEPAWNDSGGGYSATYPAPSWQLVGSAAGPIGAHGFRGIPDVAGPSNRNFFYYGGQARAGQGTSFATPMWAGLVTEMDAVSGDKLGFVSPRVYVLGAAEANGTAGAGLVDITSGANCLGNAVTGWDQVTGWGSPRAKTLYLDLVSTFVNVSLVATPAPVLPGGALTVTVLVLNLTSGRPISTLPVQFALAASNGYTGPCGGSLATAVAPTNASGFAVATLGLPGCYFGSHATVSALVQTNGFFGSNSTSVAVNLESLAGFLAALHVYPYNVIGFVIILLVAVGIAYAIGEFRHKRARARATRARAAAAPPVRRAAPPAVRPAPPKPAAVVPLASKPAPSSSISPMTATGAGTTPGPLGGSSSTMADPIPTSVPPPDPPPLSEETDVEPDLPTDDPVPSTVPDHVLDPSGPAPAPLPSSGAFACPVCHAIHPVGTSICSVCGTAL